MTLRFVLSIVIIAVATPVCALAADDNRPYYMWVDKDGVVNFSQQKPRGTEAKEIYDGSVSHTGTSSATGGQTQPEAKPSESNKVEFDEPEVDAVNEKARAINCAIGQRMLKKLNAHKFIYMKDKDGWWRQLSPEQYEAQVEKAHDLIGKYCPAS